MHVERQIAPSSQWKGDAVLYLAFEGTAEPLPGFRQWMDRHAPWLPASTAFRDFEGKYQQAAVFYGPPDGIVSRVICAGLGTADTFQLDKLRGAAASAFRKCRDLHLSTVALPVAAFEGLPLETGTAVEEFIIAGLTSLHRLDAFKTRDVEPAVHPERLVVTSEQETDDFLSATIENAQALSSGICMARDLVAAPANRVTPLYLADSARCLAQSHGFQLHVIDMEEARNLDMGAFLAVAQGSREPACMIVLEHAPAGCEETPPLVFIGKGITFDTGGISLKPSSKLDSMKQDMAGAAAVLGAFEAIGRMGVKQRVVGILPCTENMPDGKAYKPGDVIRSMSGLTIEVISTDAEGRMILCDALTYALRYSPAAVVDIATLTGACIIALGHQVAAVLGNREEFVRKIMETGIKLGERLWQLPLWDFYFEDLKSEIADMKNVGDRSAGTIVGAIFLQQFVPPDVPWAHMDIAGTAWAEKDQGAVPKGATGFGVRTLVELARRWAEMKTA